MKFSNEHIPIGKDIKNDLIKNLVPFFTNGQKVLCRDPFILPYDNKYYMYRGAGERGVTCIISDNLKDWYGDVTVFSPPKDFHGKGSFFWAPEVHYYNGRFYMFTSVASEKCDNHRVISSYVADNPLGPFKEIAIISPNDWDSIDGTFYVDKTGVPWLCFVHEWTSLPIVNGVTNGAMVAVKLNGDLTKTIGEPIELFKARDPQWARNGVTDGPFLYRTDGDRLLILWSNFSDNGYVVAVAQSDNGEIDGKWSHEYLLFDDDGGHCMVFKAFDGTTLLALHTPNMKRSKENVEHLKLLKLTEKDDILYTEKYFKNT